MATEITNSAIQTLGKSSNCLIVLPTQATGDAIASALALRAFLRKLDKEVTVAGQGVADSKLSFLEGYPDISPDLNVTKNFVIQVSTRHTAVDELSYKKDGESLLISLKPKTGEFEESDVSFNTADFPYDLIITVGVSGFDALGDFYGRNAELFFKVPVLNIDYRAQNEAYGQINLIELTATSCAEVVMDLIGQYESSLMDNSIATALLAGIITETNSFQHTRTTPQTFLKASELVGKGANQQQIVTALYHSKSMSFLKLWGLTLARLSQDPALGLVHASITKQDLDKSQATDEELDLIIPEMASQLKTGRVFVLFVEDSITNTKVYCSLPQTINPSYLFGEQDFKPITPHGVRFSHPSGLIEAEAKIIQLIKIELNRLAA